MADHLNRNALGWGIIPPVKSILIRCRGAEPRSFSRWARRETCRSICCFLPHGNILRTKEYRASSPALSVAGDIIGPQGNIWAIDCGAHIIVKMDPTGRVQLVLGRSGEAAEGPDRFNGPTDVAVTAAGDFYVSDGYGNKRIAKFTREGRFLMQWGQAGSGQGGFALPHGIAVDKQGRVYVADRENGLIQIFDGDGKFITQWDHVGRASGFAMTADEFLFVAAGNRIFKLNLEGKILGVFGKPGKPRGEMAGVHHLAVSPSGDIYTAELSGWRAQRFVQKR